ncbi:hypothetical protein LTR74_011721 [Friedmanniomyces endolithicus]|nr:hypothetical protein LTR74_011721 [Friedmanniomyces endolithicus]
MPSRDYTPRADTDRVPNVGAEIDAAADMYLHPRTSGKAQHPHDSHAQLYSQAHHYWSTEIGEHEMNPRTAAPPQ